MQDHVSDAALERLFEIDEGLPCPEGTALLRSFADNRPADFAFLKRGDLIDLNNSAGAVIARQRPGTASGFIFISGEDETGISNAIIHPKVYERNQMTVTRGKFLLVEGVLQNQDGVISVKASAVRVLELGLIDMRSHDFH